MLIKIPVRWDDNCDAVTDKDGKLVAMCHEREVGEQIATALNESEAMREMLDSVKPILTAAQVVIVRAIDEQEDGADYDDLHTVRNQIAKWFREFPPVKEGE